MKRFINDNKGVMTMKKVIVLTLLLGLVSVTSKAQDDLYFTPKKSSKVEPVEEKVQESSSAQLLPEDRYGFIGK